VNLQIRQHVAFLLLLVYFLQAHKIDLYYLHLAAQVLKEYLGKLIAFDLERIGGFFLGNLGRLGAEVGP
jgi:hypothetical protein